MSIADTLIKQILSECSIRPQESPLPDDAAPDDGLLQPEIFADAPGLVAFQQRVPDSNESVPEIPGSIALLGFYQWMASPGIITLYRGNIEAYWKALIRHAQRQFPFITPRDAERVLQLLVYSDDANRAWSERIGV